MNHGHTVVGLGEILWDVFPDGPRFGGAPANFACHAAQLGATAHMVSAIGPDELGVKALKALEDKGVNTSRVARSEFPTGADHVTRECPRMMALLARFAHAIQVNRTHEEIRNIQDSFLVLDQSHYVRRPVAQFYRGALGLYDETEALAMRTRFQEIWGASFPGVSSTTLGL
jgi:hypothetical protein